MPPFWNSRSEKAGNVEPRLVTCIECGGSISTSAYECPHCKTRKPFGYACAICQKVGKKSEGIEVTRISPPNYSEVSHWVHKECLTVVSREAESVKYTCAVCKNTQIPDMRPLIRGNQYPRAFADTCSKCGHPIDPKFAAIQCTFCCMYLLPISAVREGNAYIHKTCIKIRKRIQGR